MLDYAVGYGTDYLLLLFFVCLTEARRSREKGLRPEPQVPILA